MIEMIHETFLKDWQPQICYVFIYNVRFMFQVR